MSGHTCGACGTPVTGHDALCGPCWQLVPRDERQVFMVIWRQVQARALGQQMLDAATNLLHGFVRYKLAGLQAPNAKQRSRGRASYDALILAALPTTEAFAIAASELAKKLSGDVPSHAVVNWLTANRETHPRLRWRDINRAEHHGRPRYVYWALPAEETADADAPRLL